MKLSTVGQQQALGLFPVAEMEFHGLPMGVLSDGTPFLTQRGLATICGVESSTLSRLVANWSEESQKPRGIRLIELMQAQGFDRKQLYIITMGKQGETHAYSDAVCMAFLEYYAFEADTKNKEIALTNYRLLARLSFRQYIYDACGYNPNRAIPDSWKNYHDRILLNDSIPLGYFSIFREMSGVLVNLINAGCIIDDKTVPDISVGTFWSRYWVANQCDSKYGGRHKFPHEYPEGFRQAAGGTKDAWIYPMSALGEFRVWLYQAYVANNLENYLSTKVSQGAIAVGNASLLLTSLQKQLN